MTEEEAGMWRMSVLCPTCRGATNYSSTPSNCKTCKGVGTIEREISQVPRETTDPPT